MEMVGYIMELFLVIVWLYLVCMLGNFLVEIGKWDYLLVVMEVELDDFNISYQVVGYFLQGYQVYWQKDEMLLAGIIDILVDKWQQVIMIMVVGGVFMCSMSSVWGSVNKVEVKQVEVMELELKVLFWCFRGDEKKVEKYMVRVVNMQYKNDYSYGLLEIVYFVYEFYVDYFMEQVFYVKVLEMYEMVQERGLG